MRPAVIRDNARDASRQWQAQPQRDLVIDDINGDRHYLVSGSSAHRGRDANLFLANTDMNQRWRIVPWGFASFMAFRSR
jgi:hypothetical protein